MKGSLIEVVWYIAGRELCRRGGSFGSCPGEEYSRHGSFVDATRGAPARRRSRVAGPERHAPRARRNELDALLLLVLIPDLSMLGYLKDSRVKALSYNLGHTHPLPAVLVTFGVLAGSLLYVSLGLIWFAHIGFDRMIGFGLKYPTGFRDTHLGWIGV